MRVYIILLLFWIVIVIQQIQIKALQDAIQKLADNDIKVASILLKLLGKDK